MISIESDVDGDILVNVPATKIWPIYVYGHHRIYVDLFVIFTHNLLFYSDKWDFIYNNHGNKIIYKT